MTKQQHKGQKLLILLLAVLEIASLAGAYAANYFTKKRMGMLRHMVYMNGEWEKLYPISSIKIILLGAIAVLSVLVCIRFIKNRQRGNLAVNAFLALILGSVTTSFLTFGDAKENKAYYIVGMCLMLATLVQNIIYHFLTYSKREV